MKKQKPKRDEWFCRRVQLTQRSTVRDAGRRQHRQARNRLKLKPRQKTSVIPVPDQLLAETHEQRAKLATVIHSAMKVLRTSSSRVRFDFSKTKKLYPGGTLVFLAYLEVLLQTYPGRIQARCPPRSLAAQLMSHFGIAGALGISKEDSEPTADSVVNWRYVTGTVADGQKISSLLNDYRSISSADIPEGLYDVLAEALTNVRHHAYPKSSQQTIHPDLQRWWLFARYVEPNNGEKGNLYIAVYDVGVGIPSSMRQNLRNGELVLEKTDELLQWVGVQEKPHLEHLLLQRAVENPRSSTGLAFRGKGLPEMKDFVMGTESGRLYIISGDAQYSCIAETSVSKAFSCDNFFSGTLILWSIPLHAKEQHT